ncbi:dihydrolipoyl dehydrogenase [Parvimonas micra]|uniref:Dihydrolipoyl dehydrogenase n=1 Tax=Parvimonas micra TaxID=33033 RepID=A0AAX3K880_9FIRM|nr:dihydrolipoyl dehydrogenase [Parvimonas micra]WBB31419.1 dihydrolipoyl dehydrogenase [Parvimonas micra]
MLTEVIMPKAGSEMEEGQIVKWLKKEGDKVEAGEIILEIMTDKVNMEIEAETSGTLLKILKHDGEIVPVITTIAYIGDEGDVIPETASAPAKEEIKEEVKAQVEEKVVEVKAETKKELKDGEYDVVVIGGGPAGYYSAIKAAQKGAKVAIAENNKFGGTCLNRGCIPTKTYLQNVEDIERIKVSSKRGIILENDNATVDVAKALKFKNSIVKKLTAGVEFLLKSNSVEMFKETAYINSNGNVTLESEKELVCGSIIFAGGSKCVKNIKGSENSNVIDTDEALDLKEAPESLVIIGADYIGVEMAQIFSSFGSKVTVVERKDSAIEVVDSEVSSILIKSLEKSGIKFIFGKEITEISGEKVLAGSEEVASAKVILLTTREADLTALKDVKLEVSNGNIVANDKMQSSLKNVYVLGDVNGKKLLAHAAFKMGDIAASEIVEGKSDKYNNNIIPRAIYTYPEIGSVGLTEEEAKKSYDVKVGKFNYGANGRALAHGDSSGMVKIISDARYGEILGAHIVGPRASELINEVSILMQSEVIVEEAIKMVFGHPTFSEAIYEAIADVEGVSVHLPKK